MQKVTTSGTIKTCISAIEGPYTAPDFPPLHHVLDKQGCNEQWDRANSADREHAVGGRSVWTDRRQRRDSGTRQIAGAGRVGRVRAIQTDGISLGRMVLYVSVFP
jgi:hypothetical protein